MSSAVALAPSSLQRGRPPIPDILTIFPLFTGRIRDSVHRYRSGRALNEWVNNSLYPMSLTLSQDPDMIVKTAKSKTIGVGDTADQNMPLF